MTMSIRRFLAVLGLVVPTVLYGQDAELAENSYSQENRIIKEIAEIICGRYLDHGSSRVVSANGEAKAELQILLKKLVDLGIEGAGSLDIEQYEGVVRSELRDELSDIRKCRLSIWPDLRDRLLGLQKDDERDDPRELPNLKMQQLALLNCVAETEERSVIEKIIQSCDVLGASKFKLRYIAVTLGQIGYLHCRNAGTHSNLKLGLGRWPGSNAVCEVTNSGAEALLREGMM